MHRWHSSRQASFWLAQDSSKAKVSASDMSSWVSMSHVHVQHIYHVIVLRKQLGLLRISHFSNCKWSREPLGETWERLGSPWTVGAWRCPSTTRVLNDFTNLASCSSQLLAWWERKSWELLGKWNGEFTAWNLKETNLWTFKWINDLNKNKSRHMETIGNITLSVINAKDMSDG